MAITSQPAVLAFGDSLTCGIIPGDSRTGPYTEKLQQLLPGATLVNDGVPGDKAIDMMHRLRSKLTSGFKYTHLAILAGTNDLCFGTSPEVVLQTLKAMYAATIDAGSNCIAVTIPQFGPSDKFGYGTAASRACVNDGIRSLVQSAAAAQRGGPQLLLADFDAAFTKLPPQQRASLFVDTVHMSREGYDTCALTVYDAIVRSRNIERPLSPSLSSVRSSLPQSPVVLVTPRLSINQSIINQHRLPLCKGAPSSWYNTLSPGYFASNPVLMKGSLKMSTRSSPFPRSFYHECGAHTGAFKSSLCRSAVDGHHSRTPCNRLIM